MKREHEQRFSNPARAILEHLVDWTTTDDPTHVENLGFMNETLQWNHCDAELDEMVEELNDYIEDLRRVPIEVRRFIGAIAQRMHRLEGTPAVQDQMSGTSILISDVKDAFRFDDSMIREKINQLESYSLGGLGDIDLGRGEHNAITIKTLGN